MLQGSQTAGLSSWIEVPTHEELEILWQIISGLGSIVIGSPAFFPGAMAQMESPTGTTVRVTDNQPRDGLAVVQRLYSVSSMQAISVESGDTPSKATANTKPLTPN